MKYSTATKIIERMRAGEQVKLRKSRNGGISSTTWCFLCDVLFYEGILQVGYDYLQSFSNKITVYYYDDRGNKIILSNTVSLY
jgi:hypothetical protein